MRLKLAPQVAVRFHEYANLFPMLQGEALDGLREDIRQNGVREPVVFLGDAILDGRNRYMCARDLGVEYPRVEYEGDDPLGFVISHNLHRRHLTESQRASVAAKVANMRAGDNQHSGGRANLPDLLGDSAKAPVTVSQAASMLNVSERSVKSARKVQERAPELVAAVDDGSLKVSLAAEVAELPADARQRVAVAPSEQRRDLAREEIQKARPVTVTLNTGKVEWYTPPAILEAARSVLGGFDLDPASSEQANETVKAARIFTAEDDGLSQDWPIGRVWMNPPYAANLVDKFISRFCSEVARGSTGFVLVNNATETGWFHELLGCCAAVCFPKGRLRFICPEEGEKGTPLQGQAIFYFGPDVAAFMAAFEGRGGVLCPLR